MADFSTFFAFGPKKGQMLIWHVNIIHHTKSEFNEDSESEKINAKSWPKKSYEHFSTGTFQNGGF